MGNCVSAGDAIEEQEQKEREEGQKLLRDMVLSGAEKGGNVDWAAIISKAEELHAREQELIRKRKQRNGSRDRRRRKKEMARRRKEEAVGSFSVNMLTYRPNEFAAAPPSSSTRRKIMAAKSGSSGYGTLDDTSNRSSNASTSMTDFIFSRSWDEGMTPIDETVSL